ncbi:MAG: hypothetical protein OEY94_00865 [Alphaproteobacteria bacterium]|nr:hypothetical protein [Alphaproteobacteria bacterium]
MNEENRETYTKNNSRLGIFVLWFLILLLILLLFLPVRQKVCELTGICYFTCVEYSGEPVKIELNKTLTCEEMEFIKQQKLLYRLKSTFGLSSN